MTRRAWTDEEKQAQSVRKRALWAARTPDQRERWRAAISAGANRKKLSRVPVEPATLDALKPHADKRGVRVDELVRRLLAACLDGMVDAVLDDLEGA